MNDKTIKLWFTESGLNIKTFTGHTGSVTSVCFSPNFLQDNLILSVSDGLTIKLWCTKSVLKKTFTGHTDYVMSVCFSPNFLQDNLILSGSYDNTIKL